MLVLAGSDRRGAGDEYRVREAYRHPKYDPKTVDYDVALIVIHGQFKNNQKQRIIPLATNPDVESLVGLESMVTGYGRTSVSQTFTVYIEYQNGSLNTNLRT